MQESALDLVLFRLVQAGETRDVEKMQKYDTLLGSKEMRYPDPERTGRRSGHGENDAQGTRRRGLCGIA